MPLKQGMTKEIERMKYGPLVAKKYKKQYFKRGKWSIYDDWDTQPEQLHLVVSELTSKAAIEVLLDKSWTRYLRVPKDRK
jgi:hypothetical protein